MSSGGKSGSGSARGKEKLGDVSRCREEGMESLMGRLNILADEVEVVDMSDEEDAGVVLQAKWSVVGKILSPTVIHVQTVMAAMRPAWGNPCSLRARPLGENLFFADFPSQADRDRALEGSPWMVGRHAVLLQELDERLSAAKIRFDMMSIWMRILNLPIQWLNKSKGQKIVSLVDKNCVLDVDDFGDAAGSFPRARVSVPVDKPLRRWVTTVKNGKEERFDLQYEKLTFFCHSCGIIGHGDYDCPTPAQRDKDGKLPFDRNPRAPGDRRRKLQSFSQAAAFVSWNSDLKARNNQKSNTGFVSSRSSRGGVGENSKADEDEVNSPNAKAIPMPAGPRVSKIARDLFSAGTEKEVLLPKKRKPAHAHSNVVALANPQSALVIRGKGTSNSFSALQESEKLGELTKKQKNDNSGDISILVAAAKVQPCQLQ